MGKSYSMPTTFIGYTLSQAMCTFEGAYIPSPRVIEGQIKSSPYPASIVQRIGQAGRFNKPVLGNLQPNTLIMDFDYCDPYTKEILPRKKHRVIFADVFQNLNVAAAKNIPGLIKMRMQLEELEAERFFYKVKCSQLLRKIDDYGGSDFAAQEALSMAQFVQDVKKKTTSYSDIFAAMRQPY